MEEIGATNPDCHPLLVLWRRSCAHAHVPMLEKPFPWHPFTRLLDKLYQE